MTILYNIKDFELGRPAHSGHVTYPDAVYVPPDTNSTPLKVVFKKNKHDRAELSRLEVAFSQLARLFLARESTPFQKLVTDDSREVVGLAVQHLCYVIENKEGEKSGFYNLTDPATGCELSSIKPENAAKIPYYFLDKLPQGFFVNLLEAERSKKLSIDYSSLASILTSSYTLEEDDLHKGNFGFYIVKRGGKPQVVFFKIDHDLMYVDSIMSFTTRRVTHFFSGCHAFDITARDLRNFPNLSDSSNTYWPSRKRYLYNPRDNKEYKNQDEVDAFASLAKVPEFERAKWLSFYKHILLSDELIQASLRECLDYGNDCDRSKIALISQATIARQANLKAMLFSLKEFRDVVTGLTEQEKNSLIMEIEAGSTPENRTETIELAKRSLSYYEDKCKSEHFFEEDDTPLHIAIKLGDYRYDETLRMYGNFINCKNSSGKTPLDIAMEMEMSRNPAQHSTDIRKDMRLTMKHLLQNGAEESPAFTEFNKKEQVESYQFATPYLNQAIKAKTYHQLKDVLRDLGEDSSLCLKFKKQLAVECITQFIHANTNRANLKGILTKLRNEIDGNCTPSESAGLSYIRQLRSRLWIIRQIRGMYGWTTTQGEIHSVIDKELERLKSSRCNSPSFFEKPGKNQTADTRSGQELPEPDLILRFS